jgi:transcriptional regulator with XRE-family HTH domain
VKQTSPVVRRRRLGIELRAIREAIPLRGDEAARLLKWSNSKLSRIETGRSTPTPADVTKLLDLYKVADEERREQIALLTREARRKGWWQLYSDIPYSTYIGLEAEASEMLTYENVVPGLFQTERYAKAINEAQVVSSLPEDALEQQLEVRLTRQTVLTREKPLEVRAVLDESALRRLVGGPAVMKEQISRLIELADEPNIIVQVIPFKSGAHPGTLVGPFVILRYPDPADRDVLYVEGSADPYLDREGEVERYGRAFDHLRASAISASATLAMMKDMVKEL